MKATEGERELYDAAFKWYAAHEDNVRFIANKYVNEYIELDELLSYSFDVIAECIRKHDPAKGTLTRYTRKSLKWYFARFRSNHTKHANESFTNDQIDLMFASREEREAAIDAKIDLQYIFERVESSEVNSSVVVILYDLYGCTFAEIAEYLSCSTGTARTRYEESLRKIKHAVCA